MKIQISDFVKTGKFGPIKIGDDKVQVLNLLGEPDDDIDLDGPGSILLYAWYELFFDTDGKLRSIQNDNYNPRDKSTYEFQNQKFSIDSWFLNEVEDQNIESISKLLIEESINYEIVEYFGRNVINVSSGIVIDFDEVANKKGINELIGIRYWP